VLVAIVTCAPPSALPRSDPIADCLESDLGCHDVTDGSIFGAWVTCCLEWFNPDHSRVVVT